MKKLFMLSLWAYEPRTFTRLSEFCELLIVHFPDKFFVFKGEVEQYFVVGDHDYIRLLEVLLKSSPYTVHMHTPITFPEDCDFDGSCIIEFIDKFNKHYHFKHNQEDA